MRQQSVRPKVRNLAPMAFDRQQHAPRNHSQVELLAPPESPILLGDDFKGIVQDWRVVQPAFEVQACRFVCDGRIRVVI